VDDLVICLLRPEMVERNVTVLVPLIVEYGVSLGEGPAFRILAGKPYRIALEQDRAEGESLGGRPVDALAGLDHLLAVVEEPADGAVDLKVLRHFGELAADFLERLDRHGGLAA